MSIRELRRAWKRDEVLLKEIGRSLERQRSVTVRLPRRLLLAAIRNREDTAGAIRHETKEERRTRYRAGTLALIGLQLSGQRIGRGTTVKVTLNADYVGGAPQALWDED